jgi:omega-6 fatty acid desaturase (delta-12 desaturase)
MLPEPDSTKIQLSKPDWYQAIPKYAQPNRRKATWQILDTFIPYLALWVLMVYAVQRGYSYWITIALGIAAAGLLLRIFILFHDCSHGSFFASHRANRILGYICGILAFTPYDNWRRSHAMHHATVGDLDRRGVGDVWTLTVEEYLAAPRWKRLAYRSFRNPFVLFGIGPGVLLCLVNRFSHKGAKKREHYSVILTNLSILAIVGVASLTIGLRTYFLIQLSVILVAGTIGVWLFYVQHQFEGLYWARHGDWDPMRASLEGSSCYKLPKVLQWFTGNIGLHHAHHVQPSIPNYNLQQCYDDIPALQAVERLTIRKSLKSLWLNLWDEDQHKLVGFHSLKKRPGGAKVKRQK